jgi:hybrid cluster-associated redox disulfide protein
MRETIPGPKWTVADLLARYPETAAVFSRFRMACVGCTMAPFETLAEAADAYQFRPEVLLRDLRRACRRRSRK